MSIPRDQAIDSTLSMLREGYPFLWNRFQRFGSDAFELRVLGRRAVAIHGREATEIFYDESKMKRHGAIPQRVVSSLFGKKAVHTLDGDAHRQRKMAFWSLMAPSSLDQLMKLTADEWRRAGRSWSRRPSVVIFDEAAKVLTAATCAWAGVPLSDGEVAARAHDFVGVVDSFGGVGPRSWKGKIDRTREELWIARLVAAVRRGALHADPGSALAVMSHHRDTNGELLPLRVAAVEVLNVIRPSVAVAWYIAFAALALHESPRAREALKSGGADYADAFMQEVRRFYPFTPFIAAKVRAPFEWKGHRFEPGTLVLLDVYGMNHDGRTWERPEELRPERFLGFRSEPNDFIPQGGGPRLGHRCPGEWIVMDHVTTALHVLVRCLEYKVPRSQDLGFDLSRVPTRPRSGVVLEQVRMLPALHQEFPPRPSAAAARDASEARDTLRPDREPRAATLQ